MDDGEDYWAWGWPPPMPEDVKLWLRPILMGDWSDHRVKLNSDQIEFLKGYVTKLPTAPRRAVASVHAIVVELNWDRTPDPYSVRVFLESVLAFNDAKSKTDVPASAFGDGELLPALTAKTQRDSKTASKVTSVGATPANSPELWAVRFRGLQESFRAVLQTSQLECGIVQAVSDHQVDIQREVERILNERTPPYPWDKVAWANCPLDGNAARWICRATILMIEPTDALHDPALVLVEQGNLILKNASGTLAELMAKPLTTHTPTALWKFGADQRWLWLLFELAWAQPALGIAAEQSIFPPDGSSDDVLIAGFTGGPRPAWWDERPRSFDCRIQSVAAASVAAIDGLFHLLEVATSRPATPNVPQTSPLIEEAKPSDEDWPPDDDGWHFRESEAAFRRVTFEIQGVPWRLLKKLAAKRRSPVGKVALLDAINVVDETGNANGNAGEEALRSHLSRLRDILRKAFRISRKLDPLPNVERGTNAAWRLEESIFPSVSEIQRWLNGR